MTGSPRLAVRGLRVEYGTRCALESLDLQVHAGEIVGLLSANGGGKSSALYAIAGLVPATAEEYQLAGQPGLPPSRRARAELGVVFQQPSLDSGATARENLAWSLAMHGITGAAARVEVERALEAIGLLDRADELVSALSGGMRRRVDLARAFVHRPSVLLLDEPTSGLDEASYRSIWQRIEAMRDAPQVEQGCAVLLATHRPDEAARCDRLIMLMRGRVVAEGTPGELLGRLPGQQLRVRCSEPLEIAELIARECDWPAQPGEGEVRVACEDATRAVADLVGLLPQQKVTAIAIERPDLGDLFVQLSSAAGADSGSLDVADPGEPAALPVDSARRGRHVPAQPESSRGARS